MRITSGPPGAAGGWGCGTLQLGHRHLRSEARQYRLGNRRVARIAWVKPVSTTEIDGSAVCGMQAAVAVESRKADEVAAVSLTDAGNDVVDTSGDGSQLPMQSSRVPGTARAVDDRLVLAGEIGHRCLETDVVGPELDGDERRVPLVDRRQLRDAPRRPSPRSSPSG